MIDFVMELFAEMAEVLIKSWAGKAYARFWHGWKAGDKRGE